MPLKAVEIDDSVSFIMDEILLAELQNSGFEAIGPDDINAMLGFEKVKDAVGCDEISCVVEIGSALGVDYLAAGNVAARLPTSLPDWVEEHAMSVKLR